MSTVLLDPEKVSESEPSIRLAHGTAMLSAWAVPSRVELEGDEDKVRLRFEYADREAAGSQPGTVDDFDPKIKVTIGKDSRRVETIVVPDMKGMTLLDVAKRLDNAAENAEMPTGKRLSFRMSASVLRMIADSVGL